MKNATVADLIFWWLSDPRVDQRNARSLKAVASDLGMDGIDVYMACRDDPRFSIHEGLRLIELAEPDQT